MGFDFGKAAGKAKAKRIASTKARGGEKSPETDYQARAQAERKRFRLATDDDFYACICFKSRKQMADFMRLTGFGEVVFGDEAAARLSEIMPEVNRRMRPAPARGAIRHPYVYEDVEYTGDLEEDCKREAAALVGAMRSRRDRETYQAATDSPYYISLVCESSDDRDALYDRFGLWRYGAGYLDGSAWLARLRSLAK